MAVKDRGRLPRKLVRGRREAFILLVWSSFGMVGVAGVVVLRRRLCRSRCV